MVMEHTNPALPESRVTNAVIFVALTTVRFVNATPAQDSVMAALPPVKSAPVNAIEYVAPLYPCAGRIAVNVGPAAPVTANVTPLDVPSSVVTVTVRSPNAAPSVMAKSQVISTSESTTHEGVTPVPLT